jgi:hypothetical protein
MSRSNNMYYPVAVFYGYPIFLEFSLNINPFLIQVASGSTIDDEIYLYYARPYLRVPVGWNTHRYI